MTTIHNEFIDGFPILIPNRIGFESNEQIQIDGLSKTYDGFYVSYNNYDTYIYGCDTTALVIGQMEGFFILNGNHVENFTKLAKENGFKSCYDYFLNNKDVNKFSDSVNSIIELSKMLG